MTNSGFLLNGRPWGAGIRWGLALVIGRKIRCTASIGLTVGKSGKQVNNQVTSRT